MNLKSGWSCLCVMAIASHLASGVAAAQATLPEERSPLAIESAVQLTVLQQSQAMASAKVTDARFVRFSVPKQPGREFFTRFVLDGQEITLDLYPHSNRATGYQLFAQIEDGSFVEHVPGPVRTMRGVAEGFPNATVAASLAEDGLRAVIFRPADERLVLEPLARHLDGAPEDSYIAFREGDVIGEGGICATIDAIDPADVDRQTAVRGSGNCGGLCVAELANDADVEFFNALGSIAAVEARIEEVMNAVNIQYEDQIGITHALSGIVVRTAEPDPYGSTNAVTYLNNIIVEWQPGNHPTIPRDAVQAWTGKNICDGGDCSVIGIARLATMCTTQAVCVIENEPDILCAASLSAHELGHVWSAVHCNCAAYVMNATQVVCSTLFTTGSVADIAAFRNSRTCLDAGPTPITATLPFFDDFPSTTIDGNNWGGILGSVAINTQGDGEPSGTLSVNIEGFEELRSNRINTAGISNLTLSYYWQRQGNGDSPENGENLVVAYRNTDGSWQPVANHLGAGAASPFTFHQVALPAAAQHANFKFRFQGNGSADGEDDFFVDDVMLTGDVSLPGPFNLVSPADGATGVNTAPILQWSASADANSYSVMVDDNSDFSSPEFSAPFVASTLIQAFPPLDESTLYFWKVVASNSSGSTPSTPAMASFTTLTPFVDCNNNGTNDPDDISMGTSQDCNMNGIPDECDIADMTSLDDNMNGVPDECEPDCPGDGNGDNTIDINDLNLVVGNFGNSGAPGIPGDVNDDGSVDINDLNLVLGNFGEGC